MHLLVRNSLVNKVEFLGFITQKAVRTNEIVRLRIITLCSTSLTIVKIFMSTQVSVPFLSGFGAVF